MEKRGEGRGGERNRKERKGEEIRGQGRRAEEWRREGRGGERNRKERKGGERRGEGRGKKSRGEERGATEEKNHKSFLVSP